MKLPITLLCLLWSLAINAGEIPAPIYLWPGGAPGSDGKTTPELIVTNRSGEHSVYQVHKPSLLPYLPTEPKGKGTAMIVIPGGGHRVLAISHEGYNLGEWFAERGVAAFVLKYRLARETNSTYTIPDHAMADLRRAIRLVRSRASEWNIDPNKIGVIGFSAGGELAAGVSNDYDEGNSASDDLIERISSKPNFQALIYPGRSGQIMPNEKTVPAFLAAAYDDRQDISEGLAEVYLRFKRAKVPAELHIYSRGGHGFGVRSSNQTGVGKWTDRFMEWMRDAGYLETPAVK